MTNTPSSHPYPVFDHGSLQDAEDALRVAVGLGYEPPLFPGTVVYSASVTDSGDGYESSTEELGIFISNAAARVAVRNWVVIRYYDTNEHPLLEDETESEEEESFEEKDYSTVPDDTIITKYFEYWEGTHSYTIQRILVEDTPERVN